MARQQENSPAHKQSSLPRTIDPLTAAGALLVLIAGTVLITYTVLVAPGKISAQEGPPERFLEAATYQAQQGETLADDSAITPSPSPIPAVQEDPPTPPIPKPTTAYQPDPTELPEPLWPVPSWAEERYWLTIPVLDLNAAVVALGLREREVDGVLVQRLLVPNFYAAAWDITSAEPGFPGNTILTGHSNFYGGVFSDLHQLTYGNEIAVWSEYGVLNYYVSIIEYLEESDQPLEVRYKNAEWLNDTPDDRLTLITCWPQSDSAFRLIIVATR